MTYKKTHKLSIDIDEENYMLLRELKQNNHQAYGKTINGLLRLFAASLPSPDGIYAWGPFRNVKEEMATFIKSRLVALYEQYAKAEPFQANVIRQWIMTYSELYVLFNDGICFNESCKDEVMKTIEIKDSVLIIPSDWIDINPDDAKDMLYAGVVECHNATKHEIPYFVFHTNCELPDEYDTDMINELCVKAWPHFADIEASWVEYYKIYVEGEPYHTLDYKPPFGAKIVRSPNGDDIKAASSRKTATGSRKV